MDNHFFYTLDLRKFIYEDKSIRLCLRPLECPDPHGGPYTRSMRLEADNTNRLQKNIRLSIKRT